MARNADTDDRTHTRGQALTALGCLKKLAEKTDTRAIAALKAWDAVQRDQPPAGSTNARKTVRIRKAR